MSSEKVIEEELPDSARSQINDDDLRRYKEIFQLVSFCSTLFTRLQVDTDGGGSIEQEELGTLMRTLGLKPSDEEITEMMREA